MYVHVILTLTAVCIYVHVYLHVHVHIYIHTSTCTCTCMYNIVLPCTIGGYDVIYCIIMIEVKWLEGIKYKVSHVFVHICFKYTTIKVIYSSTTIHHLYINEHMGVQMDTWVYKWTYGCINGHMGVQMDTWVY